MFGVDEAGKGPVLGSMFAACVKGEEPALPEGVVDSKRLSPSRREELDSAIRDRFAVSVAEVPVARIDGEEDMNTLTVAAQAEALAEVAREGDEGIVDAGDVDAARFGRRVADAVEVPVTITAEHGADDRYPIVAAASIVAKVARDAHVAELEATYGEVGSGYPSDPTTREFLRAYVGEHGELPACARASWATSRDVLAAAEQQSLDSF
ncbi:ribonuclease HII [Natronomonas sp. EA1]|uniref:ribonuclease HII n=1 Tax=Natronomonas sp. EA1 TaxID=3421655 RepID=UPI003EB99A39